MHVRRTSRINTWQMLKQTKLGSYYPSPIYTDIMLNLNQLRQWHPRCHFFEGGGRDKHSRILTHHTEQCESSFVWKLGAALIPSDLHTTLINPKVPNMISTLQGQAAFGTCFPKFIKMQSIPKQSNCTKIKQLKLKSFSYIILLNSDQVLSSNLQTLNIL